MGGWGDEETRNWGGGGVARGLVSASGIEEGGPMAYEVKIDPKPGYLHVRVTGENSAAAVSGYLAEVRGACERLRCPNVLVEENLAGPGLGAFDVFGVVSERSREAGRVMGRMAFVDVNPEHDARLMRFAETVAVNRGMMVRVFGSVGEAEGWLNGPG